METNSNTKKGKFMQIYLFNNAVSDKINSFSKKY